MVLKPLGGKMTGSSSFSLENSILGGVLISADGTNSVTVTVTNSRSEVVFDVVTKLPAFICGPIRTTKVNTASVSGTNGYAQFFEWLS